MWKCFLYCALLFCIMSVFGEDISSPEIPTELKSSIMKSSVTEENNSLSSKDLPEQKSEDEDENSLAEALRVLQRRKREISRAHRPYSSHRPLGTHRYRYPLYKKRAAYYAPEYYDEDSYGSTSDANYFDDVEKPSLFRERGRGPTPELISNAHFSSKPIYHKKKNINSISPYSSSKDTHFNLETTPYDLNIMGRLYELGKRAENSANMGKHMYLPYDLISNINPASNIMGTAQYFPDEAKDKAYSTMLKNVASEENLTIKNSINRQKRASVSNSLSFHQETDNNNTTNRTGIKHSLKYKTIGLKKATERQKRANQDSSIFLAPSEDEDDFLTREYFKTIARSVGNKRKRMAYAKFEAQKRSNDIDTFLENPQMLHYVQQQIREAEEQVAKDAENEIRKNSNNDQNPKDELTAQVLLSNSIARLDALERMRESLYQLEKLQEQETIRKRGQDLMSGFSEDEKEKRRKALRGRLIRKGQMEEEEDQQKEIKRQRKEEEEERKKKKEEALSNLIKGNRRDDCPVLERIVINCIAVTEMVADEDMVFLESCLRHEICYMCGFGLDVSRHECDALLSSGLEAGCNDVQSLVGRSEGALDCLSAAGETYNILSDPSRYDDKGTCTYDPCVRQLIDSR